jgi:hypothetical protein
MAGDFAAMAGARIRAKAVMTRRSPGAAMIGVYYSVPRADDPPYTATALLPAGHYAEAA